MITLLNEKGIPTPLAHVMLCSPRSRMDVLSAEEVSSLNASSELVKKYSTDVDAESAYEILNQKLKAAAEEMPEEKPTASKQKEEPSTLEKVANNTVVKSMLRTAGNGIVRSLLGALGLGGRTTRKKSSSWF